MLLLMVAAVTLIETGQLLLPGKNADFTDGALEFVGGALGYFGSLFVAQRLPGDPAGPVRRLRG